MKIVSVINYKGGVGKTTLTANLGGELAFRDKNVLLVDLDPQTSLTFSFITPDDWKNNFSNSRTIKNWFDSFDKGTHQDLNALIFEPTRVKPYINGKLDLISSHLGLINVDLELATQLAGANLTAAKRNYIKVHSRLLSGLKELDTDNYDLVLIDCPPNFNIVTKNSIVASDYVLIPAKPDYLSTLGIDYLITNLKQLIGDYNEYASVSDGDHVDKIDPKILGVVFTMIQLYGGEPISTIRPFISQTKRLGKEKSDFTVFESYFRENKTLFAETPVTGVPVVLNSYKGKTYKEVVSEMEDLVSEFIDKSGI